MVPAVPIGAAGEKFLKFDAFLCIFKAFLACASNDVLSGTLFAFLAGKVHKKCNIRKVQSCMQKCGFALKSAEMGALESSNM